MLEIPEAIVLSRQLNKTVKGKGIQSVEAAKSPHRFAWYFGEPSAYQPLLEGKTIENAAAYGGRVEIEAEGAILHFADGVNLRYYGPGQKRPEKHQLLLVFEDASALAVTVAMYGGIWCCPLGAFDDNEYTKAAKEAVPPLSAAFDYDYFITLFDTEGEKMSAKAFLATKQRIPGLGNGVLQDILLGANINPRTKINALSDEQREALFHSLKSTLTQMVEQGGRDTEKDLWGNPGGYQTKLSKTNKLCICPVCGGGVKKETYLGGSIYYCTQCQPRPAT